LSVAVTRTINVGRQTKTAMLFRLTADIGGQLIGCCNTRTIIVSHQCWPSKNAPDIDGRHCRPSIVAATKLAGKTETKTTTGITNWLWQACYGVLKIPPGSWLCRACAVGVKPSCVLCPNVGGGAMKSTRCGFHCSFSL